MFSGMNQLAEILFLVAGKIRRKAANRADQVLRQRFHASTGRGRALRLPKLLPHDLGF